PPSRARAAELRDPISEDAHIDVFDRAVGPEPAGERAEIRPVGLARRLGDPRGGEVPLACGFDCHGAQLRRRGYDRLPMDERWTRLASLAVHGANVQPGQTVMVSAEIGQ